MPARKKSKNASAQEEQLRLLKQILAELQTLNANLAARAGPQIAEAGAPSGDESDDDELEEYE